MKKLILFLGIFIIILGVYSVQQYFAYMGPQLAVNQAIKNDIERVRLEREQLDYEHEVLEKQIRREVVTNTLPYAILTIFVIVLGSTGLIMYLRYDKRKESWHRQIEGSYALQDLVVNGVKWKVDVNKSPSGAIGVAPNGMLLQAPVDNSFGPDRQLTYNNKIQNTRTATAVTSGENGIPNAATGKFLAGAYDRNQKQLAVKYEEKDEIVDIEPVKLLTLDEAIKKSDKAHWIVGQDAEGNLSEINIRESIHLGILGASGSGKSASTGLLIAYYARKSGYHVIVLDGKGLHDWSIYGKVFEVHKTNALKFKEQIIEIADIYTERKKKISDLGIEDFYGDRSHGETPILLVVEEYGKIMDELEALGKNDYNTIIKAIASIMRDSRAVGIHLLFIEQETSRWNPTIKSLVKHWTVYKLEASAGRAINFYHLDKLANCGQFASSTNKKGCFNAWHTKALLDVNKAVKPLQWKLLTDIKQDIEFVHPLEAMKNAKRKEDSVTVDETGVEEIIIENKDIVVAPVKRFYEDLTDKDKELIRNLHFDGQSLRTITVTLFGEGKFGRFYNDIVRKVLEEN